MADAQLSNGDDVKAHLIQTSDFFRQLVTEHQELDQRIRHLATLSFLSEEQQYEATSLKKQKLAMKDRIQAALRGQLPSDVAAASDR